MNYITQQSTVWLRLAYILDYFFQSIPNDWQEFCVIGEAVETDPEAWQSCSDEKVRLYIDRSLPDMKALRSALTQTHFPTLSLHHMF